MGKKVLKYNDAEKAERYRFSRAGAEITLGRVNSFEELNAPDLIEGNKIFLAKTRELWKEFAVHGFLKRDEKTNELYVDSNTDLDGKCCLELFKLAGINKDALNEDLKYIAPGDYEEGRINLDTGGKHGVSTERTISTQGVDWNKTAFIDHHAKESPFGSSAASFAYRMLADLGLFKKNKKLDAMIDFVTSVDSGEYPDNENYYNNSWKTIAGLYRYISGPCLLNFFSKDKNPDPKRELTEDEMRKYGFVSGKKDRGENQKRVVEVSRERLEQMQKDGFFVPSKRYGQIVVNVEKDGNDKGNGNGKKNIPGDFEAVRAFGADALVTWDPANKKFKISSSVTPIAETYSQGLRVRERMWVKNNADEEELHVTLQEILNKMTDGEFIPEGKLKEYLEIKNEKRENKIELDVRYRLAIEKFGRGLGEDMYNICIDNGEDLSSDEIDLSVAGFIKRGISEWLGGNKEKIGLQSADGEAVEYLIKEMAEKIFSEIKKPNQG